MARRRRRPPASSVSAAPCRTGESWSRTRRWRCSLSYTQERLNELLYYRAGEDPRHSGFVRIEAGPQHRPYGLFCVAPGHQLGLIDLKTIEVAEFLAAIAGGEKQGPDFREAWEIQKVIDTAVESSRSRSWLAVPG